ncbi:MAG: heme ABC exporter ATP-binding protein CcmA [Pseudomonadota bacterium]
MPTLTASGLACQRGGYPVFSGVDLEIATGQTLQVTGRNGSGKSSLLRLLCGLLEPAGGTIRFDAGDPEARVADHCHYLGHENGLKPQLTTVDNLDFWRKVYGPTGKAAREALSVVGLDRVADLPTAYLSAGQKRRAAIARLLVSNRSTWLLDEPTAALDRPSESLLGEIVDAHTRAGGLTIVATHLTLPFAVTATLDLTAHHASARVPAGLGADQ